MRSIMFKQQPKIPKKRSNIRAKLAGWVNTLFQTKLIELCFLFSFLFFVSIFFFIWNICVHSLCIRSYAPIFIYKKKHPSISTKSHPIFPLKLKTCYAINGFWSLFVCNRDVVEIDSCFCCIVWRNYFFPHSLHFFFVFPNMLFLFWWKCFIRCFIYNWHWNSISYNLFHQTNLLYNFFCLFCSI